MKSYQLTTEVLEYASAPEPTNTDPRTLVVPSKNVLIDRQRKVTTRLGYSRLGASNTSVTPIRNAWTWKSSTGLELPQRFYDDELEVYLGTVDGTAINAWKRVLASWNTTEVLRATTWWDTTENLDVQVMCIGDANLYEWSGGVAVYSAKGTNTLTKGGTSTWQGARFYVSGTSERFSAITEKIIINVRTGTEYTYTGGETTTTLTGVTPDPASADIVAGDIFVQKVATISNAPASGRTNDTIFSWENHIILGSYDDNELYISKDNASASTDYADFTFSSPRVSGEGELLELDGPGKGFGILGKYLIAFAGNDSIYRTEFEQITVGTTLVETLKARKVNVGVNVGSFGPDSIVSTGNALIYLSNEPAVRLIQEPDQFVGSNPQTLSNPIKPDFDAETFTNAFATWYKNAFYLSSPTNSNVYILEFVEDADGKLRRFWQPPQVLPARPFSIIDDLLYIHSNSVPETYKLFDGYSDTASDDSKLPIHAIAAFSYNNYGKRGNLKSFDEYVVEGIIRTSTNDLNLTLNYDYGGATQSIDKFIDGTDQDITEETLVVASLGQQSLGQTPLGGNTTAPDDASKFQIIFELAREDFRELQAIFSTNESDRYWSILSHGPNAKLSKRMDIKRKK